MTRQINDDIFACLEGEISIDQNLYTWLKEFTGAYLLIHASDGVIWGRVDSNLVLKSASADTKHDNDWQQVRIFNEQSEVLLWREADGQWQGRRVDDIDVPEEANFQGAIDEYQLLWGNVATPLADGFTELSDYSQGLRHCVPVDIDESQLPLALWVRHYIEEDQKTGFARIAVSRLVGFAVLGETNYA